MRTTKFTAGLLGTSLAAAAALSTTAARAAGVVEFASVGGGNGVVTYTAGPGGGLSFAGGPRYTATFDLGTSPSPYTGATLTFTGLNNNGPTGVNGVNFDQALTGGTFLIQQGTTELLGGSFTGGDLTGVLSGSSKSAFLDTSLFSVTYDGLGSLQSMAAVDSSNPGNSFNFSFLNVPAPPGLFVQTTGPNSGYLNGFTASGNGQFQGYSAVPEPTTVASFGFGSFGLLGLMLRARKARKSIA